MQAEEQLLRRMADMVQELVDRTPQSSFADPAGMGASGAPVKHIDQLAEDTILRVLDDSELPLNICSEEMGTEDRGAERTLIIDPIDGTTNACRGIPFFSTSLAITSDRLSGLELGLVRNLATGDTYVGKKGKGAWRNGDAISTGTLDEAAVVASPIEMPEAMPSLPEGVEAPRHMRGLGSAALELCLVAQGAMDVFMHTRSGLRIVDIAAGTLILEEAGGAIVTPAGERPDLPLDVAERTNLLAAGDRSVIRRMGVPA